MKALLLLLVLLSVLAHGEGERLTLSLRDFGLYLVDSLQDRDNDVWLAEVLSQQREFKENFMRQATYDILTGPATNAPSDRYAYRMRLLPSLAVRSLDSDDVDRVRADGELRELEAALGAITRLSKSTPVILNLMGRWAPPISLVTIRIVLERDGLTVHTDRPFGGVDRYHTRSLRQALRWLSDRGAYTLHDFEAEFPTVTRRNAPEAVLLRKMVHDRVSGALGEQYEKEIQSRVLSNEGLLHLQRELPLQRERRGVEELDDLIRKMSGLKKTTKITVNARFSLPIGVRRVDLTWDPKSGLYSMRLERSTNGLHQLNRASLQEVVTALRSAGARSLEHAVLEMQPGAVVGARRRVEWLLSTMRGRNSSCGDLAVFDVGR